MKQTTYYHKNSDRQAYWRADYDDGYWEVSTFNKRGQELTYINSDGFWLEAEYDKKGNNTYFRNARGAKFGTPKKKKK